MKALAKSDQPVALSGEKEKYWWFKIGFGNNSEGWVYGAFLGTAIRTGKPVVNQDFQTESHFAPWQ